MSKILVKFPLGYCYCIVDLELSDNFSQNLVANQKCNLLSLYLYHSLPRSILVEVFVRYPNQVFWQLVAILKSSFKTRSGRCEEVIKLNSTC